MEAMMILMTRVTRTSKWPHEHSLVLDPCSFNSHYCNVEISNCTVDSPNSMVFRNPIYFRKKFQESTNLREVNRYSSITLKDEQLQ
jgi:hypothetical protein